MATPSPGTKGEEAFRRLDRLIKESAVTPEEAQQLRQAILRDPRARLKLGPPKGPGIHRFYRFTATALGASMWFFLMYRAKKDGPALLGWKHPWEH